MMTLTYQDTNEGKCKKCGRELEHLRGVSTGSTYCECRWCGYARLKATNAELLEALENLTRWVGKGIADGAYSECVNSERALVDLERATEAIRKAKEK